MKTALILALALALSPATLAFQFHRQNLVSETTNWSGAHWNAQNEELWLVRDNGQVRSFDHFSSDGSFHPGFEFKVDYDLEGITQIPQSEDLFLLAEREQRILQVSLNGKVRESWFLSGHRDVEGIAFVSNGDLERWGFVDSSGAIYADEGPFAGVFFVAQQRSSHLLAFSLLEGGEVRSVGRYLFDGYDPRALEYDTVTGRLYVLGDGLLISLGLPSSTTRRAETRRWNDQQDLAVIPGQHVEGLSLLPAHQNSSERTGFLFTNDQADRRWGSVFTLELAED